MLSRVADSLYWMGRYIERAEHTSRMLAVRLESMVEQSKDDASRSWARVAAALSAEEFADRASDPFAITGALSLARYNPSSLLNSLGLARDNARQVREQLSTDIWEHLNRLYLRLQPVTVDSIWGHQPAKLFRETLENLYMLDGVIFTTLRHGEGWYFLELGRYIERAQLVSRLLDIHFGTEAHGESAKPLKYADLLALLKYCTAFEPYCKEHTAAIKPERIAEFLLFDAEFPHSVKFAVDRMREALAHVAPGAPPARRAACERLAGRLKAAVDFGQIDELIGGSIDAFLSEISRHCEHIHEAVYAAYIAYGAETVL
ncbi:MAG: alpha-E domain-containing protein [Rhizomicrobium sp.]